MTIPTVEAMVLMWIVAGLAMALLGTWAFGHKRDWGVECALVAFLMWPVCLVAIVVGAVRALRRIIQ